MTPRLVDEVAEPGRPGYWRLPHWDTPGLLAGITDQTADLRIRDRPAIETSAAWSRLLADQTPFTSVIVAPQEHGSEVLVHAAMAVGLTVTPPADGHLTPVAGTLIAVTVADCVPVYLHHPPTGWIGLLHAGWRGVAAGILRTALSRLSSRGLLPDDVVIHCGVSICGRCYEVGPEVHRAVSAQEVPAPAPLDRRAALARSAADLGVREVTVSGLCTREHPAFHSHRGSGGAVGRMAAYVGRMRA